MSAGVCPDPEVCAMNGAVYVCWSPPGANASRMDWLDATEGERFGRLQRVENRLRSDTSRILLNTVAT
jgi:hypothetical protein